MYTDRVDQEIEVQIDSPTSDDRSVEVVDVDVANLMDHQGCSPFNALDDPYPIGVDLFSPMHGSQRDLNHEEPVQLA